MIVARSARRARRPLLLELLVGDVGCAGALVSCPGWRRPSVRAVDQPDVLERRAGWPRTPLIVSACAPFSANTARGARVAEDPLDLLGGRRLVDGDRRRRQPSRSRSRSASTRTGSATSARPGRPAGCRPRSAPLASAVTSSQNCAAVTSSQALVRSCARITTACGSCAARQKTTSVRLAEAGISTRAGMLYSRNGASCWGPLGPDVVRHATSMDRTPTRAGCSVRHRAQICLG